MFGGWGGRCGVYMVRLRTQTYSVLFLAIPQIVHIQDDPTCALGGEGQWSRMDPGVDSTLRTAGRRDRYSSGFCSFFTCPELWTVYFGLSYTLKFAFRSTKSDDYGPWTRVALFENGDPWAKDEVAEDGKGE